MSEYRDKNYNTIITKAYDKANPGLAGSYYRSNEYLHKLGQHTLTPSKEPTLEQWIEAEREYNEEYGFTGENFSHRKAKKY